MRNIKLTIEYDGTNYGGWQIQKNNSSVQEEIQSAISIITSENVNLIGSSRTDAGVHAMGMVANFKTESTIPAECFSLAINTKLPRDIGIIKSEEVPLDFHSRYDSKGKTYAYTIINRKEKLCINRNYAYHVKEELDFEKMKRACKYFEGKHDFVGFKTSGSSVKTTVRTISDLHIDIEQCRLGTKATVYITADGFLYNMVRIIVGTLVEIGKGKIQEDDVKEIIDSKERKRAGHCAPASGLTLMYVYY